MMFLDVLSQGVVILLSAICFIVATYAWLFLAGVWLGVVFYYLRYDENKNRYQTLRHYIGCHDRYFKMLNQLYSRLSFLIMMIIFFLILYFMDHPL